MDKQVGIRTFGLLHQLEILFPNARYERQFMYFYQFRRRSAGYEPRLALYRQRSGTLWNHLDVDIELSISGTFSFWPKNFSCPKVTQTEEVENFPSQKLRKVDE